MKGGPHDRSPVGTPGGRQNWVDKAGGLPGYIREIVHALQRGGMSESRAIATAVATVKRWAAGGGKVSADTRAKAAAALAEWEAKRGTAHALSVPMKGPAMTTPIVSVSDGSSMTCPTCEMTLTPTAKRKVASKLAKKASVALSVPFGGKQAKPFAAGTKLHPAVAAKVKAMSPAQKRRLALALLRKQKAGQ